MESSGMVKWWQADGSLSWFRVGFSNKRVLLLQEKFEVKDLNMKPGMSLKIKGKIHNDVDRFLINLGQGKETLNLHFNPRFDESTIVCNTSEGGRWGQEQRENHMCFSPGSEVKVRSKENPTKALQPQPGERHQAPVRTLPWLS